MTVDTGSVVASEVSRQVHKERSSPHATRFRVENESDVFERARSDNGVLRSVFFNNLAHEYNRLGLHIPEQLPEIPIHVGEVALIAKTLILFSNVAEKDKEKLMEKAEQLGLTHDFGRIGDLIDLKNVSGKAYDSDNHCIEGVKWLDLMGFDDQNKRNAMFHHTMGQGHKDLPNRIADVVEQQGVAAAIAKIEEDQGLLGLIFPLADLSKSYKDENGNMSEAPFIAEFNPQNHKDLVDRQVGKGHFSKEDPRYTLEINGGELLMGIIAYLEYTYNINYKRAIFYAKECWQNGIPGDSEEESISEYTRLQHDWTRARETVLQRASETNTTVALAAD